MNAKSGDTYMFAPDIETMGRDQLAQLQLAKLKKIVKHAYDNVPLYTERLDAAGIEPGDLKSLDDYAGFPFTVKEDLRATYPLGMFAVGRADVARFHASSGTTGKPTVVGYTREDLDVWADLMARCMACAGARPGDILHNA